MSSVNQLCCLGIVITEPKFYNKWREHDLIEFIVSTEDVNEGSIKIIIPEETLNYALNKVFADKLSKYQTVWIKGDYDKEENTLTLYSSNNIILLDDSKKAYIEGKIKEKEYKQLLGKVFHTHWENKLEHYYLS